MTPTEFFERYQSRITQASERLFVEEFLFPLIGHKIEQIEPQAPFIDRTGLTRNQLVRKAGSASVDLRPIFNSLSN